MPRRSLSESRRPFELHRPPRRGEVYWVSFGAAVGGEIRKTLTTASRKRLVGYMGRLGAADMEQVDRAIRLQLDLA